MSALRAGAGSRGGAAALPAPARGSSGEGAAPQPLNTREAVRKSAAPAAHACQWERIPSRKANPVASRKSAARRQSAMASSVNAAGGMRAAEAEAAVLMLGKHKSRGAMLSRILTCIGATS